MNRILKHLLVIVCTLGLFQGMSYRSWGQAQAIVDTREIIIGDQINLLLSVRLQTKQDKVLWAKIPDTLTGLEILEKGKIDTVKDNDVLLLQQKVILTGFDSGRYVIPSLLFQVNTKGQVFDLSTDSIWIDVQTLAVDTTKTFKPIKNIVEVPFSWLDYWKLILATLLLAGLGIFIWIYFYKNKKTLIPSRSIKAPPELSHEKALRLLQELREKQLWEHGYIKEYYSELSDITRVYLEERFGIAAMEQTTDELLALLKKQNDSRTELRKLRPELKLILRTADLAKFAKANPLPHEHGACMEAAVEVVKQTKKKAEEDKA